MFIVLSALLVPSADPPKGPALPPLNQKVLKFAEDHLGKQVGDGECWTLARDALRAAEAREPGYDGTAATTNVFGRRLKPEEKPLPGDVVWFEQVKMAHKDGRTASMPSHAAIISKVEDGGFVLLHQNYGAGENRRKVQRLDLTGYKKTEGTMFVYRPVPSRPR
jgi:hypothetical protein